MLKLTRIFILISSAYLLCQCSSSANHSGVGISPSRAGDAASFSTPAPSSAALARAAAKQKDRHGMPIYTFGEKNRVVRTTAYTNTESDHVVYGVKNAVGTNLKYNSRVRSAAADWSYYPVGTVFKIKGQPYLYVVDDYGSALTGTGTIDIFQPTRSAMNFWGTRKVEVNVVQWGSLERSANLLSRRTGYSHCRQMLSNVQRLRGGTSRTASR